MLTEFSMDTEVLVRLSTFAGLFAVFAVWELVAPRRTQHHSRSVRWLNNLALTVLNGLVVRLGIPLAAVGTAIVAQDQNLGLLNQVTLPAWFAMVVAILALDLILYFQHLVFHHVDFLWRLHRMHHADLEVDVTTGLRFHPIEIVLSMAIKMAAVLVLMLPTLPVLGALGQSKRGIFAPHDDLGGWRKAFWMRHGDQIRACAAEAMRTTRAVSFRRDRAMTGLVASGICDLVDEHGREMRARDLVEGWRREADGIANRRSVTREGLEQTAGFFRQAVFQVPEQKRREASRQQR